jgi:hypothetical protein
VNRDKGGGLSPILGQTVATLLVIELQIPANHRPQFNAEFGVAE